MIVVVLTACSVEGPEQSLRVTPAAVASIAVANTVAAENAGLRAEFKAP